MTPGSVFNPGELRERTKGRVYPPAILGRRRDVSDGPKRVYQVLYDRSGANGCCWPSFETIAYDTGKSVRQVKNDVAELERFGLIQHKRRRRESNVYEFIWAEMFEVQPIALQETQEVQETARQEVLEVQDSVSKKCSTLHANSISEFSQGKNKYSPSFTEQQTVWFSEFWTAYPRKVGKKIAEKAFRQAVKTEETWETVRAAIERQTPVMLAREPQYRPHPASWIRGERWTDEVETPTQALTVRGQFLTTSERNAQIRDAMFRDLMASRFRQ